MSIQIRVAGLVLCAIVASAATAQSAVEWKVSDGGNGHWYERKSALTSWTTARTAAVALGAHLATINSSSEDGFVKTINGTSLSWLGGFQDRSDPSYSEPSGGWRWVTGEPWSYTGWFPDQPDNWNGAEDYLHYSSNGSYFAWNDLRETELYPSIVEWDADCNNDGIVDYGQIKSGQLADDNTNGIPDICETSITGVLPPSVPAQGGSTITINGRNFPAQPSVLVGGVAATNVVRVSDSRLTAVTPPLLPGMAPLTVNGFTLPDAIYIRPECGSDLDQNGSVDAADISIILLDFGPCYEPPATLAAPAPTPLLADEPAQKPVQR